MKPIGRRPGFDITCRAASDLSCETSAGGTVSMTSTAPVFSAEMRVAGSAIVLNTILPAFGLPPQ